MTPSKHGPTEQCTVHAVRHENKLFGKNYSDYKFSCMLYFHYKYSMNYTLEPLKNDQNEVISLSTFYPFLALSIINHYKIRLSSWFLLSSNPSKCMGSF